MPVEDKKIFYSACYKGDLAMVKELSNPIDADGGILKDMSSTGFFIACNNGQEEIVRYLLDHHPQIDVNRVSLGGWPPLWIACYSGYEGIVKLLLRDERIDVNKANKNGQTPLWIACWAGNEGTVKILLAGGRELDVNKGKYYDEKEYSPAEIAKKERYDQIAELTQKFGKNPTEVRERLRKELKWTTKSGEIFVLGALLCDGYLKIHEEDESTQVARFFNLFSKLHLDVQMVLINRSQGLKGNFISKADQDIALTCLLQSLY